MQLAYNIDHSENFVERNIKYRKGEKSVELPLPDNTGRFGSGFVSWQTSCILKDNDGNGDYHFEEIVSGMTGRDVGIIQPPFSILPQEDATWLSGTNCVPGNHTSEFVVENIPYQFAVPMLTGWDLRDSCGDQMVRDIGVWIEDWNYTILPGATGGTLRYTITSRFKDDGEDDHVLKHKISILGLRPIESTPVPSERFADLIPASPSGSDAVAFCRLEEGRKLLRVTVKNQGAVAAGPSKTTVAFGSVSMTMNTPSIPAGGSTDLLFKVPGQCFSPDCLFRIVVDSAHQINEGPKEGNNTASGTCKGSV